MEYKILMISMEYKMSLMLLMFMEYEMLLMSNPFCAMLSTRWQKQVHLLSLMWTFSQQTFPNINEPQGAHLQYKMLLMSMVN